jgi:hypothetical protein
MKMNETTTKQKMTVHFNDDATETYDVDDSLLSTLVVAPNMLWYSAREYELFRKDTPCKTKETTSARQFVQSLLSQQQEHKNIGISDPKGLLRLSKVCSKGSRLRARQLAAENEQDVADFLERRKYIPPRNSVSAVTA